MDKNIYKFIFYLVFFVSIESNGQIIAPTPQFDDIFFNELMVKPAPIVKLPKAEAIQR